MQLMLCADDVLIGVGHLGTRSDGLPEPCDGDFAASSDAAVSVVDQVSLVKHWRDLGAVDDRNEISTEQIEFLGQLTNCCIQRQLVIVTSKVEEDLALAISLRINRNPETGSPVVSKGVVLSIHVAGEQLLLPADAEAHVNVDTQHY